LSLDGALRLKPRILPQLKRVAIPRGASRLISIWRVLRLRAVGTPVWGHDVSGAG
jgi:hypothetical protein